MVRADVREHCRWQQAVAIVAGTQLLADAGGIGRLRDAVQSMYAEPLRGRKVERVDLLQREAGAADDDPLGELEKAVGIAPEAQV